MPTHKLTSMSRKTKKNIRKQKGGASEPPRLNRFSSRRQAFKFKGNKLGSRYSLADPPSITIKRSSSVGSIAEQRKKNNAAVATVVKNARFLKQTAITSYATPTGGRKTIYNSNLLEKFLREQKHSPQVAARVAQLIRNRGIRYAAQESGIEYRRPTQSSNA